jgi:hypothetical protein
MQRKMFYFVFFVLFIPSLILGQGIVRGKVTDLQSGEPLIGANVLIEGTQTGAATDVNGEYILRNLNAGTYSIKASFIGYQSVTISNVRVTTGLTTEMSFQLPSEGVEVGTVEIIAERPLIQKDNTNKVRTTTSDDIEALPVRGVNNIVALTAGVVVKDDALFIRGGRLDEVGYYLEGTSITNPVTGGRAVTLSQDAIEEIQVQAGGYTAEFGGANAGIVKQQLKTGGNQLKASAEYITDNVTFKSKDDFFDGEKRLGTRWYGYNESSVTLSGPVFDQRFKFFGNFNYSYQKDRDPQPYPGINLGLVGDASTGDTVNMTYPAGAVYNNAGQWFTYTGTLNMDFKPVIVRLSGTFTTTQQDAIKPNGNIIDMFNPRIGQIEGTNGTFNAKVTHVINPSMYYELSGGYFLQTQETFDPYLKDNYWAYGDSVANAQAGVVWQRSAKDMGIASRHGRYASPSGYDIMGFQFTGVNAVPNNYAKIDRRNYTVNGAFNLLIGKTHTIKVGGEFQQYTLRSWAIAGQTSLAALLNSRVTADTLNTPVSQFQRSILIANGVNNYGYDVYGNETDEDGFNAPHKPTFASAFIQDKIELDDIILNVGVRYDYIDVDNLMMADPTKPELSIVKSSGELIEGGWKDVPTFDAISPRLGFSFPVTDNTVFHAQYGKFIQQSRLLDIYQGYYRTSYEVAGGFFFTNPVGKDVRPTRTTQYELGFTQQLNDFMSFDVTGYYKDIKDQVVYTQQFVEKAGGFEAYNTLTNGDFATTKGVELTLNMRRHERLSANATLAFQDARGTGSSPNSNRGIVGAPLDGVTVFTPKYISPLEFNNSLRGNINVDYRFGQNDGPSVLHEFGVSVLATFNSGHPYTRGIGGADLEGDARNRQPVEALNSSTTPAVFQIDLRVDKTVRLYDRLAANIYIQVINLFDTKNVENVFLRTGATDDDGYISNPELSAQLLETYGQQYVDFYNAVNIDYYEQYQAASAQLQTTPFFYGTPRQIRLGIRLEY